MIEKDAIPPENALSRFVTYSVLREINPSLPAWPLKDYRQLASAETANESGFSIPGKKFQPPILTSDRPGQSPKDDR